MNGEQLFIAAITLVGPQLECISGLGDSVYLLVRMPHLGIRNVGWEAGIRTPIGGSRVRSLTVRRPPNVANEFTVVDLGSQPRFESVKG